jgi:hypothetical protein
VGSIGGEEPTHLPTRHILHVPLDGKHLGEILGLANLHSDTFVKREEANGKNRMGRTEWVQRALEVLGSIDDPIVRACDGRA